MCESEHAHGCVLYYGMYVEVRGQFEGIGCFFLLYGSRGIKIGLLVLVASVLTD